MSPASSSEASRPVWDLFVRVFHWTLVGCVLLNQFVLEEGETPHEWAGYLAAALVVARFVWGFIGSRHARFSDFSRHRPAWWRTCGPCGRAYLNTTGATTRWAR